jgi:hypothetical protein
LTGGNPVRAVTELLRLVLLRRPPTVVNSSLETVAQLDCGELRAGTKRPVRRGRCASLPDRKRVLRVFAYDDEVFAAVAEEMDDCTDGSWPSVHGCSPEESRHTSTPEHELIPASALGTRSDHGPDSTVRVIIDHGMTVRDVRDRCRYIAVRSPDERARDARICR